MTDVLPDQSYKQLANISPVNSTGREVVAAHVIIESVNGQLKNISEVGQARAPSVSPHSLH